MLVTSNVSITLMTVDWWLLKRLQIKWKRNLQIICCECLGFFSFLKKIITSLMVILKLHEMLLALNVYHRRCFHGKYRVSSNMTNNPLFGPMAKLEWRDFLKNLRIHSKLATILETRNKGLRSNIFWYVKVYIFCKFIQYTIQWDNTQIVKNLIQKRQTLEKMQFLIF